MKNKKTNSKLWRVLGIAVIALVVLAGVVMGSYAMGARTGGDFDGGWMNHSNRFEEYDAEDGAAVPYDGNYAMPMHGRGRMFPGMGFFMIGRILGGLLFLGLLFVVLRRIFFPHWRHPHFDRRFAPHHPHFGPEGCDCENTKPEPQAASPEVPEEEN